MASKQDLRQAARSLQLIVEKTQTPQDSLQEIRLQDHLLLAATVLEAASRA